MLLRYSVLVMPILLRRHAALFQSLAYRGFAREVLWRCRHYAHDAMSGSAQPCPFHRVFLLRRYARYSICERRGRRCRDTPDSNEFIHARELTRYPTLLILCPAQRQEAFVFHYHHLPAATSRVAFSMVLRGAMLITVCRSSPRFH